jgi:uncharacterized repeat protein (TIGR01451 family)
VRASSSTTIFVDRNGRAPFDASTRTSSSGERVSFTLPLATRVMIGEVALPRGFVASIDCGAGPRAYAGGPFRVTSPARRGAILRCVIVNRALQKVTPKPKPKPRPKPTPKPLLTIVKTVSRHVLRPDQTVDFVITVRNRGGASATNVRVCDQLPDGLVFVRAPVARFVRGDACWRIQRLRGNSAAAFLVRARPVRMTARKVLVNVASVAGVSVCASRSTLGRLRTQAVCSARARVTVLPARGRGGGVTG